MTSTITSTEIIDEKKRLKFMPTFLGNHYFDGEALIFTFMKLLSPDYSGGFWRFFTLSNGGYYMAPDHDELMQVQWDENYYSGEMSAEAAGITACLFTLSHMSISKQDNLLAERFHALREFALEHKEASEIFRAID